MKEQQLNALRDQIAKLKEKTRRDHPSTTLTSEEIRLAIHQLAAVAEQVLHGVRPDPDDETPRAPAEFQRFVR